MSLLGDLDGVIRGVSGLVDEAVIVARVFRWSMIRFANNEPTVVNNWVTSDSTVYLTKSRRFITTSLSSVRAEDLSRAIQESVKRLGGLPEDELYVPLTHVGRPRQLSGSYDPSIESSVDRVVDGLNEAIQASLSEGSVRNAGALTFGVEERFYVDSTGLELEDKSSFITLTIRAFADDVSATSVSVSRTLSDFKPRDAGRDAGFLVSLARGLPEGSVESGRYNVVLGPLVAAHLYGLMVSSWFNAYSIITEMSGIGREDLGKVVASEGLVIEDLSGEGSVLGSESFDYEGNATANLTVVNKGVLANVLHNNRTAGRFNVSSTGHAVDNWVRPRPRHVRIGTGGLSSDINSLITELGNGLVLTNNWYTRFQNIKEGLFSTVIRDAALLVRDGRLVARLRGLRIADSFRALLRNFVDSSREARQVYWWDLPIPGTAPYVLVKDLNITKG
ncbi:MAG: TldD/PmbA family protein [Vulcanisaeta sp. AZ3]